VTPTGSLELHAARAGPRTVLRRLRYDGTLRCSRAFPHEAAALVVTSQLGPGIVHGDRLRLQGTLDESAHLIVTAQSATRIMGGERTSISEARWSVAAGALLELIGEPLVPAPGARFQTTTRITLEPDARVLLTDAVGARTDIDVRSRTIVERDGRECLYDALDVARCAPGAIGTLALFGLASTEIAAAVNALDAVAGASDVRVGIGAYSDGVFVRLSAPALWPVRERLFALRTVLVGLMAEALVHFSAP
jgi:urease accessory protein UreH